MKGRLLSGERSADSRRKYARLGFGELTAAAVFAFLAASGVLPVSQNAEGSLALWSGLAPLLVILVQAGTYWLLARGWVGCAPMPSRVAHAYRAFRVVDPVMLAAGLTGVLVWLPSGASAVLILGVWLFGVIEYVNYFVVRLAYPIHQWPFLIAQWRSPRLVKDLKTAR